MNIVSVNSVNIDIDNDSNDADGNRDFNVTKDGGATKLFTVNDGGDVDVHNGNLDVQGGTVENTTGDLTLKTSGTQAQKLLPGDTSLATSDNGSTPPNIIGGHPSNSTDDATVKGSTIVGGGGDSSTGDNNEVKGNWSTVAGGKGNLAFGNYSFVAGRNASDFQLSGAFVWGDSSDTNSLANADDQVVFQAGGGMYIGDDSGPDSDFYSNGELINTSSGAHLTTGGVWTDSSSRAVKHDIDPVDGPKVLEKVTSLPVSEWTYDDEPDDVRHMGPMAEDFYETFGLGSDDEHIASLDSAGVALAAIKGLSQKHEEKDDRIKDLEAENEQLRERNAELEDRLAAVEAELGIDATANQQGVADD